MCRMENIFATVKKSLQRFIQSDTPECHDKHIELLFTCFNVCFRSKLLFILYYLSLVLFVVCTFCRRLYRQTRTFFCDACRTWNTHESRVTSNDCMYMQLYNNNDDYNCCLLFFWKEFIFFHIPISGITCTKFPLF